MYAPLLAGAAAVVYEGKPVGAPDAGALAAGREHGVKVLFARPHRAARDPQGGARGDFGQEARHLLPAGPVRGGGAAGPGDLHVASTVLGVPVVDHWWRTETGVGHLLQPIRRREAAVAGCPTVPVPGSTWRSSTPSGSPWAR
ncbi:hypothetical protein QJS66_05955 [Kocuria rhizophila]|nr:hypothetical protein QJS66_05955 [Kocuria rhizophila]